MSHKLNPLTRSKIQKARALMQHGQSAKAKSLLLQICNTDRSDPGAWYMLGVLNQQMGALEEAAAAYSRTIALRPDHADAHYFLGNTQLALNRLDEALISFAHAVRANPLYLEARINLCALYELQRKYTEAETCYREALRLKPDGALLHHSMGVILHAQGKYEEAAESYRRALVLEPRRADTCNGLGNALARAERLEEAVASFRHALGIDPNFEAAYNNLGNTLKLLNRLDEAFVSYQKALEINPRYATAHANLGNIWQYRGKYDEAIVCFRKAIEIDPRYADAHLKLASTQLATSNFTEGWKEYAWRRGLDGSLPRPHPPSSWDGSAIEGRPVFLHAEQGLGDEIFFLRFVGWLKRRGAGWVSYCPSQKLRSILSRVSTIDSIACDRDTLTSADLAFYVGDLPGFLGMKDVEEIPSPLILEPLSEKVSAMKQWLSTLGTAPYIGVTWRAGTKNKDTALCKETPGKLLAQVLKNVRCTVLILQRLPEAYELESFRSTLGRPAHDFSVLNENLEQMLALLALIDDYVGVSNTNMHLRAAVGKTARVLVPAPPEWRWMAKGKESPWFPGFGVYRQRYDGSWDEAFDMLATDLKQAHGT